jgi:hypothetical protein
METHEFDKIDLLTFVTGGYGEKEAERIDLHVRACPSCRSYVDTFRSQNAAFLRSHPYEEMETGAAQAPFRSWRIYGIAASIVVLLTAGYFFHQRETMPSSRIKGAAGLTLYVKNARGEIEMRNEQVYSTGERIQFSYSCGSRNKFLLLSIDATGAITHYYPFRGDSSEVLEPGQDIPLPHSIILDEYIGREIFFGVFSETKLHAARIEDSLKADFNRTKNIDSIGFSIKDVSVWRHPIVVIKGTR